MNRRNFVRNSLAALAGGAVLTADRAVPARADEPDGGASAVVKPRPVHERICLFTDHLDDFGYSYQEVAGLLKQLQIAGPDLTVRPGGLVAPQRVVEELPQAAAAFAEHGLRIPMISTGLTSAADPAARPTLATMSQLGIGYYKLGYFAYGDVRQWESELKAARTRLAGLVALGGELGVKAGFHNHAGPVLGGALWDGWELLRGLDPEWIGFYFDPAQATIEGGKHGWKLGFQRIAPRLTMVAIKDFVWEKVNGRWQTRWCPLGEGMVAWEEFFALLAQVPFDGPLSLHIEYDPGGRTRSQRLENSLAAAARDLKFLRAQLSKAFGEEEQARNTK